MDAFAYAAAERATKAFGTLLVGCSELGVCWLSLGPDLADQRRQMTEQMARHGGVESRDRRLRERAASDAKAVARALDDGDPVFPDLRLDLRGTPFQTSVWEGLRTLGWRDTITYSQLTAKLGYSPATARAVGTAVGANPVSLLVPCHLAWRIDGGLAGYRWGLDAKRRLLVHAGALPADLLEEG